MQIVVVKDLPANILEISWTEKGGRRIRVVNERQKEKEAPVREKVGASHIVRTEAR